MVDIYIYIYVYIYIYINMHIYISINMHIYIYMSRSLPMPALRTSSCTKRRVRTRSKENDHKVWMKSVAFRHHPTSDFPHHNICGRWRLGWRWMTWEYKGGIHIPLYIQEWTQTMSRSLPMPALRTSSCTKRRVRTRSKENDHKVWMKSVAFRHHPTSDFP